MGKNRLPAKFVIKTLVAGTLAIIILMTTMFSLSPLIAMVLFPYVIVPSVMMLLLIFFE